jgi:large subunit ribosomal protein L29
MKYIDLTDKSLEELKALLKEKKMLLFSLKNKLKLMQLTNTAEVRDVKKDIARILTAMSVKKDN